MLFDEVLDKLDKEFEGESLDGRDFDDINMFVLVSEVVGFDMYGVVSSDFLIDY